MKKRKVSKIRAVAQDGLVHISTPLVAETLCGYNDAGPYDEVDEDAPITCNNCKQLFNWCNQHVLK